MEDVSSSPALNPPAALHDVAYVLEPEWPHRAVPVEPRRIGARGQRSTDEAAARAARPPVEAH